MGQIFRLTSFLNNLLNFLRVIFENMIGTTDKYNTPLAPTVYDNINILGCSGDDDLEKGMPRINWVMQIVEKKTQTDRISGDRVAEEIRSALIR